MIFVFNWKMNPVKKEEAKSLFDFYCQNLKKKNLKKIIIAPPFLYLSLFFKKGIPLAAQNCFYQEKGPYTGEISPLMLKSFQIKYVILGHSERRRYAKETNEEIAKKAKVAIENNLTPIICFGEEKKEKNLREKIIFSQLKPFSFLFQKKFSQKKIFLAYEPVWAIGTGLPCPLVEVEKVALKIKKFFSRRSFTNYLFLYGGSLNSKNIRSYYSSLIDGFLIGSASLKKKEVKKILTLVNNP